MARLRFLIPILVVTACSGGAAPATTSSPSTTTGPATTSTTASTTADADSTTTPPSIPGQLEDFELTTIRLDDVDLLVAVADTGDLRRQGLMNIADLGDLDGMLFVFDQDTSGGFWMKNTLIPLDIAFFDSAGAFVDAFAMEPCTTAECPTYRPSGEYRHALEVPEGHMPEPIGSLEIGDYDS